MVLPVRSCSMITSSALNTEGNPKPLRIRSIPEMLEQFWGMARVRPHQFIPADIYFFFGTGSKNSGPGVPGLSVSRSFPGKNASPEQPVPPIGWVELQSFTEGVLRLRGSMVSLLATIVIPVPFKPEK